MLIEQGDDKFKTVNTEVSYYYRGAQFAMPQMRVPNLGRIDDVWINYKSGEWQGIARGRNMRSYEFNEQLEKEGASKNEERKRLQNALRRCMEVDVVATDVPQILKLIDRANIIRGSVLALDVIQAEAFLKWRRSCLRSIQKMQSLSRGNAGRRKFKHRRDEAKAHKKYIAETEKQSISLSRTLVPDLIGRGVAGAVKLLNSISFQFSVNMSGEFTVVDVSNSTRNVKRGIDLCPACNISQPNPHVIDKPERADITFIQNGSIHYRAFGKVRI